jgi:hypothetical protein
MNQNPAHSFMYLNQSSATKTKRVKKDDTAWLCAQAAGFYDTGIQNFVPRLNKCLQKSADCVENRLK